MVCLSSFDVSDDVVTFDGLGSLESSVIPLDSDSTSTLPRCPLEASDVVSTLFEVAGVLVDSVQCSEERRLAVLYWQRASHPTVGASGRQSRCKKLWACC